MELINSELAKVCTIVDEIDKRWDEEFNEACKKIEMMAFGKINDATNKSRRKKRAKQLSSIKDEPESMDAKPSSKLSNGGTIPIDVTNTKQRHEAPVKNKSSKNSSIVEMSRITRSKPVRAEILSSQLTEQTLDIQQNAQSMDITAKPINMKKSSHSLANDVTTTKRKDKANDSSMTRNDNDGRESESKDRNGSSLLLITENSTSIIISDEESTCMPPPKLKNKKKGAKNTTATRNESSSLCLRSHSRLIKSEKLSMEASLGSNTSQLSNIKSTGDITHTQKSDSTDNDEKGKDKVEKNLKEIKINNKDKTNSKRIQKSQNEEKENKIPNNHVNNATKILKQISPVSNGIVAGEVLKIVEQNIENNVAPISNSTDYTQEKSSEPGLDETFVSARDTPMPVNEYVIHAKPAQAETKLPLIIITNDTFVMNKTTHVEEQNITHSSLITEDESCEMSPPKPVSQKVRPIFNPYIKMAVKDKVESYMQNVVNSPANTKTSRLRSAKIFNDNNPAQKGSETSRIATPKIGINSCRIPTPKLPVIGNTTPHTGAIPKIPPYKKVSVKHSRQGSSDTNNGITVKDLKQKAVEESKRKREEKQIQAAKVREAKEKERLEKYRKLMEQKQMKILQAEEQKKQFEEIHRNLKNQQEIRKEIFKQPQKIKINETMTLEAGSSNDYETSGKIKKGIDDLRYQLLQNQKNLQEQKLRNAKNLEYSFRMLHSDDSTDDENQPKTTRPKIPMWSSKQMRKKHYVSQSQLPMIIIDGFFSVQPMSPDLKEIFPNINPDFLKRNSSMYWSTPPKYSPLPKF